MTEGSEEEVGKNMFESREMIKTDVVGNHPHPPLFTRVVLGYRDEETMSDVLLDPL